MLDSSTALLIITISCVSAFQISDSEREVYRINGVTQTNPTSTLDCNPADMEITFSLQLQTTSGTILPFSVQCSRPRRGFAVKNVGVVPSDVEKMSAMVYSTDNFGNLNDGLNQSLPDAPYLSPDELPPGARGLKELSITTPHGWGDFPDTSFVDALCIAAQSQGESIDLFSWCTTGVTPADYDTLNDKRYGAQIALGDLKDRILNANNVTAGILQSIYQAQHDLTGFSQNVNQSLYNANRTLEVIQDKENAVYTALQKGLGILDPDIKGTQQESIDLSNTLTAITNSTSNDLQKLALFDSQLMVQVNENLDAFHSELSNTQAALGASFYSFQTDLMALLSGIKEFQLQTNVINSLNALIQANARRAATVPNRNGNLLRPFADDMGQAPADKLYDLGPLWNHIDVSDIVIRKVVTIGGTPTGVATRLVDSCGSLVTLRKNTMRPSSRDMINWIGPQGCDATWQQPNDPFGMAFCWCSIVITELKCVLANTLNVPDPSAIDAFLNGAVEVTEDTGCVQGTPVAFDSDSGGLDHVAVTSLAELASAFAKIGSRASLQTKPYCLHSRKRNVKTRDIADVDELKNDDPLKFTELLMAINSSYTGNLANVFSYELALDYMATSDHFDDWNAHVNGELPDGGTHERFVYRFLSGTTLSSGWKFTLALVSDTFLRVSKMYPASDSHTVTYTVGGVTTVSKDVTVTDPHETLLPGVFVMVWDPITFASARYDISQDALPLVPHSDRRRNTVLLPLVPSPEQFSLGYWVAQEGRPFPHTEVDSPSNYKVEIDSDPNSPTYGKCVGTARIGGGGLCTMLQYQFWRPFGVFNDFSKSGSMLIDQMSASTRALINIPRGPIRILVESACPKIISLVQSSVEMVLLVGNTLDSTNLFLATQYGPCAAPTAREIPIAPGGKARVSFFLCGAGSPPGSEYVEFSAKVNNEFLPCANVVDMTMAVGTGVDGSLAATWNSSITTNAVQLDVALVLAQGVIDNQLNFTNRIDALARDDLYQYGWRLPNVTLAQTAENQNRLAAIAKNASDRARALASLAIDFTYITDLFASDLAALQAEEDANSARRAAALASAVRHSDEAKISLSELIDLIPKIDQAGKYFTAAMAELGESLYQAFVSAQTMDHGLNPLWDVPYPPTYSNRRNGWNIVGDVLVGIVKLANKGIGYIRSFANKIADTVTSFAADQFTSIFTQFILPILIIGGIAFGGFALVRYGPQLADRCGNSCRSSSSPGDNKFSPSMVRILQSARRIDSSIKTTAELEASLPAHPQK